MATATKIASLGERVGVCASRLEIIDGRVRRGELGQETLDRIALATAELRHITLDLLSLAEQDTGPDEVEARRREREATAYRDGVDMLRAANQVMRGKDGD